VHGLSTKFCEKTLWAQSENRQEDKVAGQNLVTRVDPRSESLGDTKNNSSDEGSPEIAEPSNDDRFESEYEPGRSNRGIKLVRIPRKTPAIETIASDRAIAKPKR
jgi:hypothetical protein